MGDCLIFFWCLVWAPPNSGDGYIECFMLIHPLDWTPPFEQLLNWECNHVYIYICMRIMSFWESQKADVVSIAQAASLLTVLAGLWSVRSAKLCALACVEQKRVGNSTSSGHFGRHFGVFWWSSATLLESPRVGILRAWEDYNMAWWINLPSNGEDYRTLLANARLRTQLETQFVDLHGWRLKTLIILG